MANNTPRQSIHWQELDILRGLAALLMIVNHAGYQTLAPNQINGLFASSLLFISSFAPVLFFFVTGVGYGLQSIQKKKASHWYVILNKLIILVLADLLIHWSNGKWVGLEFLGFIGLSSLVLEFVRKSKFPLVVSLIGFVTISILRYLFGPYLHALGYDQQGGWLLNWIIGFKDTPGISYPLSPWLAYPFVGYLVGAAAVHYRRFIENHRLKAVFGLSMLGILPAFAALFLAKRGASFFRWGTVGIGFYVVSFAIILAGLAISLALSTNSKLANLPQALSLKGIASLAVVPIHYILIYLVVISGGKEVDLFKYILIVIAIVVFSFFLSGQVEHLSQKVRQFNQPKIVWLGLVGLFVLAATITIISGKEATVLAIYPRTFGQIVLCLLFVVRLPILAK
jgi:uncharacterized membrane protein